MTHSTSRPPNWHGPNGPLARKVKQEVAKTLDAFGRQPALAMQQAKIEGETARGGYAHRQLYELVQNSADAIRGGHGGRICITLTRTHLYCADDGQPLTLDGVRGLMFARMSTKRLIDEIGRFGLGFKSVLRVTDSPDFISRSVSLSFDKQKAERKLRRHLTEPLTHYPLFPFPECFDPTEDPDPSLKQLMDWATNIVRLPLNKPGSYGSLRRQIEDFPAEFLLFVSHVRQLTLEADELSRKLVLCQEDNGALQLLDGDARGQSQSKRGPTRWRCFKRIYTLSPEARDCAPDMDDDSDKVPIWWAAPIIDGARLVGDEASGKYWAFFPTMTASLLGGILNAPWRTNSDRQNLLPGPYNDELVDEAAALVAEFLHKMATPDDPAAHLDLLPRRREPYDHEYSDRLRDGLSRELPDRPIVPDQNGRLRTLTKVKYPPDIPGTAGTKARALWERCDWRPRNWLHHRAVTRARLARIDRLHSGDLGERIPSRPVRRESVASWLAAIVKGRTGDEAVEASKVAIRIAVEVEKAGVLHDRFGEIVLTQSGEWKDPQAADLFFLGEHGDSHGNDARIVHHDIARDPFSVGDLVFLGVPQMSPAGLFEAEAIRLLDADEDEVEAGPEDWERFWRLVRRVDTLDAHAIIVDCANDPCVRTIQGTWRRLYDALLPGRVVPSDGTRDSGIAIDTVHHRKDMTLLRNLGASDGPRENVELSGSRMYSVFWPHYVEEFLDSVDGNPQVRLLEFVATEGSGPLDLMEDLSEEGSARYTSLLLDLDSTYASWTMRHKTQARWGEVAFESLAVHVIEEYGRIACDGSYVTMEDLRESPEQYASALEALMAHPKAEEIRDAFDLEYPHPEPIGEEDVGPLVDVWPALRDYLPADLLTTRLVRCRGFEDQGVGPSPECVHVAPKLYVDSNGNDPRRELWLVSWGLNMELSDEQIEAIAHPHFDSARSLVKKCSTDEERLLLAVGLEGLRSRLSKSVLAAIAPATPDKGGQSSHCQVPHRGAQGVPVLSDAP